LEPFSNGSRLTFGVSAVDDDASVRRHCERLSYAFGVVTEDHHDLVDISAGCGIDRVLDERLTPNDLELLRPAEPPALACGEDDRRDHSLCFPFPNSLRKKLVIAAQIADRPSRIPPIGFATGAGVAVVVRGSVLAASVAAG